MPVAAYEISDGKYSPVRGGRALQRRGPPGKDLYLRGDGLVVATGRFPLHTRPEDFHYIEAGQLECRQGTINITTDSLALLEKAEGERPRPAWKRQPFQENIAVEVAQNALVVAGTDRRFGRDGDPPLEAHGITALDLKNGKPLSKHSLPAGPVSWGIAIDREGRILVSLQDGSLLCFGPGRNL